VRKTSRTLLAVVLLVAGAALLPAAPAGAGWADANCNWSTTDWSYSGARTRWQGWVDALYLQYEGYHWGGGCANNNNVDDQPGDPTQTESTHGEGTDCSGLVFRGWKLTKHWNAGWAWHHNYEYNHGPYAAASYRTPQPGWYAGFPKANLHFFDGLASTTHVGLIYIEYSDGTDAIFEAKGEASGTGIWTRTYRGQSAYTSTGRTGWTG
jgi:hypothetical protein